MIGVAAAMLALSVGDLTAGGLTGEPQRLKRVLLGTAFGCLASWAALRGACLSSAHWWWTSIGVAIGTLSWLMCKLKLAEANSTSGRWAGAALSVVALTFLVPVVFAASLDADIPRLTEWAQALPFPRAHTATGPQVLLLLAILVFLTAPANSIIRALLTVAGTEWKASEKKVRGGRNIGVIERWMIFGLALAGEPTAAALIVSAKSLLRFPELSKAADSGKNLTEGADLKPGGNRGPGARDDGPSGDRDGSPVAEIDAVTEYFLLGSLASWGLALGFVLLFA